MFSKKNKYTLSSHHIYIYYEFYFRNEMVWSVMVNYIFLAICSSAEHRIIYELNLLFFSCRISL
jgi:hypothetical protein